MKLLLPLKVGDVVRRNDDSRWGVHLRIINIIEGCTCPNYVVAINVGMTLAREKYPREPHLHFTCVPDNVKPSKKGAYKESDCRYLSGYVYRNGERVDVDGAYEPWQSGWHEEDKGLDKIILIKAAPAGISKLTKPKIQPTTTECDDEE